MTKEIDSKKQLKDALEHLNDYSDEQLEAFLKDENPDEITLLKRALIAEKKPENEVDADKEWLAFEKAHVPQQRQSWLKVAAIFIGVILAATFTFAAIKGLNLLQQKKTAAEVAQKTEKANKQVAVKLPKDTLKMTAKDEKNVRFDNAELQNILSQMALYYKVKVIYANEGIKHIRLFFEWNKAISLDENISVLNGFQKISISHNGNTLTIE